MDEFKHQEGTTLHSLGDRTIIRYRDVVVKSGHIQAHEAPTLKFIAEKTTIPVPKVHHVHCENGKVMAIVMDYIPGIPGKRLDEAWDTLDSNQKLSIANELHSYLDQLRQLKGNCIGAIGRGPAIIGQIMSIEGGPFDTELLFSIIYIGRYHQASTKSS